MFSKIKSKIKILKKFKFNLNTFKWYLYQKMKNNNNLLSRGQFKVSRCINGYW